MPDPALRLHNTLTRRKEVFQPIDPQNVRLYVCGPTVYDYAHIGNARPAIVFDVLFRLLRHLYGGDHVTYVRNITDVDDKINARAARDFPGLPLNEAIRRVTETTNDQYQRDVAALGCLPPTHQPRATDFVLPRADGRADMASLIQNLIDRGHAYAAAGEILFDISSMADYGALSRRPIDEQIAGARVAVDAHKRHPADFVLWKQSSEAEPGWDARFRLDGREVTIRGRPGWHIECSAMSAAYLGEVFDIHGGGLDLIFPHHENEIAQSRCAHGTGVMANYWMHNGFLQVEGRKMSKTDGNFVTIDELLTTENFGGRRWPGEVLRLAMLMTHYREPIDFSLRRLEEASSIFEKLSKAAFGFTSSSHSLREVGNLLDDLNTPVFIQLLQSLAKSADTGSGDAGMLLRLGLRLLGFEQADLISPQIRNQMVMTDDAEMSRVETAAARRAEFIRERNWPEADRIRDELLAQGIQLKDGKDPQTGERVTTWEVKR